MDSLVCTRCSDCLVTLAGLLVVSEGAEGFTDDERREGRGEERRKEKGWMQDGGGRGKEGNSDGGDPGVWVGLRMR